MPQAIPFLAYAGATYLGASALAATAISFVASVFVGQHQADKAKERARRAYNASLQDRFVTVRGALATRRYVLGTVRTGGALMFGESILVPAAGNVKAQSYLDTILAWAANKCTLVGYYLDDEYVAIGSFPPAKFATAQQTILHQGTITGSAGSGSVTLAYTPVAGSITGYVSTWTGGVDNGPTATTITVTGISGKVVTFSGVPDGANQVDITYKTTFDRLAQQFKDGDPAQTSTDWSGNPDSPRWTASHRLRGVAHSRFLMRYEEAVYQTGAPDITAVLQGGGADGHPFYDPRTATNPAYTDNPALLAAWWMTMPAAMGGCGYPSDWIDWDAVGDAANVCDELVTVKTLDGLATEQIKRYRCHVVLDTAEPALANLDRILRTMAGRRGFTGGKYRIVAGAFRAATITITDDDIVGTKPITLDATGGDVTPANIATGTFADSTKKWQGTSPTTVRNAAYVTSDGAESTIDVELEGVTDPRQANYLMGLAIELTRPCLRGSISILGKGENIALFDTVQLSLTNRSVWAGKTLEVTAITDNWDGTFDLTLNEIKSASYALDYTTWTPLAQPPAPDLSYLWNVADVASLNVSLGSPQTLLNGSSLTAVALSWAAHTQSSVLASGRIEIRYRRIGDAGYVPLGDVAGDATRMAYSAPLSDGSTYEWQARARNGVGAVGHWSSVYATVIGSKAFVGHAMSITPDPGCENWDAWTLVQGAAPIRATNVPSNFGGATWASNALSWFHTKPVQIDRTRAYRAIANAAAQSGNTGTMYLVVAFFDASGALIQGGTDAAGWTNIGTMHYYGLVAQAPPTVLTEYTVTFGAGQTFGIPTNARFVAVGAILNYSLANGKHHHFAGRIQQLQETDLIASGAATAVQIATDASGSSSTAEGDFVALSDAACSFTNDSHEPMSIIMTATFRVTVPTSSGACTAFLGDFQVGETSWLIQRGEATFLDSAGIKTLLGADTLPAGTTRNYAVLWYTPTGDSFSYQNLSIRVEMIKR